MQMNLINKLKKAGKARSDFQDAYILKCMMKFSAASVWFNLNCSTAYKAVKIFWLFLQNVIFPHWSVIAAMTLILIHMSSWSASQIKSLQVTATDLYLGREKQRSGPSCMECSCREKGVGQIEPQAEQVVCLKNFCVGAVAVKEWWDRSCSVVYRKDCIVVLPLHLATTAAMNCGLWK